MDTINSEPNEIVIANGQSKVQPGEMSNLQKEKSDVSSCQSTELAGATKHASPAMASPARSPVRRSNSGRPLISPRRNGKKETRSDLSDSKNSKAKADFTSKNCPKNCVECGCSRTPLWRNGPVGPQTLCNACGLRFNKIKAGKKCRPVTKSNRVINCSLAVVDPTRCTSAPDSEDCDYEDRLVFTPRKKRSCYPPAAERRRMEERKRILSSPNLIKCPKDFHDLLLGASLVQSLQLSRRRYPKKWMCNFFERSIRASQT